MTAHRKKHKGGRPRKDLDVAAIQNFRTEGKSLREIARGLRVGKTTVERALKAVSCVPKVSQNDCSLPDKPFLVPKAGERSTAGSAACWPDTGSLTVIIPDGSHEEEIPWEEYQARRINGIFEEFGTGGRGKIKAVGG